MERNIGMVTDGMDMEGTNIFPGDGKPVAEALIEKYELGDNSSILDISWKTYIAS